MGVAWFREMLIEAGLVSHLVVGSWLVIHSTATVVLGRYSPCLAPRCDRESIRNTMFSLVPWQALLKNPSTS
ncbi:hypothetical protein F5B22DRAFT_582136 [Xylaria bambusicola]|uniref:uncharacterized protein n=1 Tax=Xylaria bambusicola TaxID=326684 RepID=UPI0020079AA9|nr:uncharacterized protein F5B22DRAFT_582136 [Xylaria bambusicola]KAI0527739.1 hypothetical protein F5B22DRAFT_582136 [Xylaria bambusicola]